MSHRELLAVVESKPFRPFDLVLTNGERLRVNNPRFTVVSRSEVYLFRTRDGKIGEGPPTVVALRNIAQIEPIGKAA